MCKPRSWASRASASESCDWRITASSFRLRRVTTYLATTTMAITITARKPRVSIVLAELPEAAGGGLVEPTGPWAQLPTVDPIRSATVVARPEAIRIESSFDTTDRESPTWMLLDNRSDRDQA